MVERLLAALIILGMLVLIMFIAFSNPQNLTRSTAPYTPEGAPTPITPEERIAKGGDLPKEQPQTEQPARPEQPAPKAEQPAGGDSGKLAQAEPKTQNGKPVVPDPNTPPIEPKAAAPQPEKTQPEKKAEPETKIAEPAKPTPAVPTPTEPKLQPKPAEPPRQEAAKSEEKLPASKAPPPVTTAPDKTVKSEERVPVLKVLAPPKPNRAYKADKLQISNFRKPEKSYSPQRYLTRAPAREDRIGGYIRKTQYYRERWYNRGYYDDCPDGRCACRCPPRQPYWARSAGPYPYPDCVDD